MWGRQAEKCWTRPRREARSDKEASRRSKKLSRKQARRTFLSGGHGMEMVRRKVSTTIPVYVARWEGSWRLSSLRPRPSSSARQCHQDWDRRAARPVGSPAQGISGPGDLRPRGSPAQGVSGPGGLRPRGSPAQGISGLPCAEMATLQAGKRGGGGIVGARPPSRLDGVQRGGAASAHGQRGCTNRFALSGGGGGGGGGGRCSGWPTPPPPSAWRPPR